MLKKVRISLRQFTLMIIICRLMIPLTYISFFNAPPANQDLWISDSLTFIIHILVSIPIYLLAMRFQNQSIIEISEIVLGKPGKLIGAIYIWFFIHITAITLRQFGEFFTIVPYPETPMIVFISITVLATAYAVYQGIESISRVLEIVAPIIFVSIILVFTLLFKDMDFKNLSPVLEADLWSIIYGSFVIGCRTSEIMFIVMLCPYLNKPKNIKNALFVSFFILAIIFTMISIPSVTIFGFNQAKTRAFPYYNTVRMINIEGFLERIDAIYFTLWVLGMFIKIAMFYFLSAIGIAQLAKLENYEPLILPLGALIVSLSFWMAENVVILNKFLSYQIYTFYGFSFLFIIPLFLLTIAMIRKKGADSR